MNEYQQTIMKGFLFGVWIKKNNNLAKAYLCLTAASLYGIRAAHQANSRADAAYSDLDTERQRPVMALEP